MNLKQFMEAVRAEPLDPSPDTKQRKAVRAPGDVGMVDRLTQMDKDKPNKKDYSKRSNFIQRTRDPVERMLAQTAPDEEIDPKFDPDSPQYQRQSRSGKQIQQGMTQGFKPGMDAVSAADRRMRDTVQDAQRPQMRQAVGVGKDAPIPDSGYLRHGYQSSGLGVNKVIDQDSLDYLYSATQDDAPVQKTKDKTGVIDRGGTEKASTFAPSARDLETHSAAAEQRGAQDKAYLTRDVMRHQKAMRDGLKNQDSEAVQRIAMQHDVSDEMLDKYINMYGSNRPARKGGQAVPSLFRRIETMGIPGGDRAKAAYGGDLGEAGDPFRNEDGTYNLQQMKKKNKDLYNQAINNRSRELVRTYLRQGGRDAYAMHEGIRSIADMDLEHIRSLTAGGSDDPSNWVFSSGQLNKLRGNENLVDRVTKYAEGGQTDVRKTAKQRQETYQSFIDGMSPKEIAEVEATFAGDSKEFKKLFTKGGYNNLTDEEIEDKRQKAMTMGMSEDDVNVLFPPRRDPNEPIDPGSDRMAYVADPEQYQADLTKDERAGMMRNKLIKQLKDKYPGYSEDEVLATPEGRKAYQEIYGITPKVDLDDY
jgi:hypothetical protein